MSVILKKDEKVQATLASLPDKYSHDEFIAKFKALYPADWSKIIKSDKAHRQSIKPGKINPMPSPDQYLVNALNVWLKKGTQK